MGVSDVFRCTNERIAEINPAFGHDGTPDARPEYVCECADFRCVQRIDLTATEYRAVRAHPLRFVVVPEHVDGVADRVVEQTSAAVVVERTGERLREVSRWIDFEVRLERRGETSYVVALAGEVDMYTAPEFKRELLAAIDEGGREIVVDLSRATFIDSTFLGALLGGHRRLSSRGGRLTIVCDDRNLLKAFEITGLDQVFAIHHGQDGADGAVSAPVAGRSGGPP